MPTQPVSARCLGHLLCRGSGHLHLQGVPVGQTGQVPLDRVQSLCLLALSTGLELGSAWEVSFL